MKKEKGPRLCVMCRKWTHRAMYLVRGREICSECGAVEIRRWNALILSADQQEKRSLVTTAALALCLVLGLAACNGDGDDTTSATGAQKCTVTVNGQEKPCH